MPDMPCDVGFDSTLALIDDLGKLPFAVGLSRKAKGVIRQNLYVSLGVIANALRLLMFGNHARSDAA